MMTAKPDKTGPRNSSLVSGKLKSRPANPLPIAAGGFVYALYRRTLGNKHPWDYRTLRVGVIGHYVLLVA